MAGRAIFLHLAHQGSFGIFYAERFGEILVEILDPDPEVAAHDLPVLPQLRQDLLRDVDRNGEPEILAAGADGGIDPDRLTLDVDSYNFV